MTDTLDKVTKEEMVLQIGILGTLVRMLMDSPHDAKLRIAAEQALVDIFHSDLTLPEKRRITQ